MVFYFNRKDQPAALMLEEEEKEEESKAAQMIFDFGGFNNAFANETTDDFELTDYRYGEQVKNIPVAI